MYLGYQNNKIKFYTEKPLNQILYNLDKIEETNEEYVLDGDEYIIKTQEHTAKQLQQAKIKKYLENDEKGEYAREHQNFTITLDNITLSFDTSRKTQQDLQTAQSFLSVGVPVYEWFDNNGTKFEFTDVNQIIQVSTAFIQKANIYLKWSYFKLLIDNAETIEEVENIEIDYNININVVELKNGEDNK